MPPRHTAPAPQPEELAFLQAIVANPTEEGLWLILADWLEEHDDPQRAELLRLHRKLLETCCEPERHPQRSAWQTRLVELLTAGVRPCVPRHTVALAEGVEMAFHFIPPGSFLMGSPETEEGREPRHNREVLHRVTLTQGYWLAVTPVTQAQWRAVTGDNPSSFRGDDLPADSVSWQAAREFCEKLREADGKPYRQPTEAEWEYACRAGTTTPFFFGESLPPERAAYDCRKTRPVAGYPCNAWGLFDMHGNVWELCQDRLGNYGKRAVRDPRGPKRGTYYTVRGGCWRNPWTFCRSASRYNVSPGGRGDGVGFRPACSPG